MSELLCLISVTQGGEGKRSTHQYLENQKRIIMRGNKVPLSTKSSVLAAPFLKSKHQNSNSKNGLSLKNNSSVEFNPL